MFRCQWPRVCAVLSICFFLSCRASQHSTNEPQIFVGQVYLIGNEPFAKLAIKSEEGQTYVLDCTKEVETALLQHQGQMVKLLAKAGEKKPEGNFLHVLQAEVVKKE
jgi:hypothetical protein